MTRRAYVIHSGIKNIDTRLASIADIVCISIPATIVGVAYRTTTATEVAFIALSSRLRETFGRAVVPGSARCAVVKAGETKAITIGAISTQKLSIESSAIWTVAARRTKIGSGGILQAVEA
jgi:hypothetical protein